jgi:hypothetical protein
MNPREIEDFVGITDEVAAWIMAHKSHSSVVAVAMLLEDQQKQYKPMDLPQLKAAVQVLTDEMQHSGDEREDDKKASSGGASIVDLVKRPIFSNIQPHIVDKFVAWHIQNPEVWELFKKYCYELWDVGRRRYGSRSIIERIRWHTAIHTKGSEFKICDHYNSCYSRLMILHDDRFKDFFVTKQSYYGDEEFGSNGEVKDS